MSILKCALIAGLCLGLLTVLGCGGAGSGSGLAKTVTPMANFAYGADVSWVTHEEASGEIFHNAAGAPSDALSLLQHLGTNAIRLRVWVNPADDWNGMADTLAKAQRAQALGCRLLIDFHYSDTWADPGHQSKPAAWAADNFAQLQTDVYTHTFNVLNALKNNGIAVDWVQVGNEINGGMLWPDGSTQNFAHLVSLINSGYAASKAVYPNAQVVLHLANGHDNATFRWFFDNMQTYGAHWDVIGMSHYPSASNWLSANQQIGANMTDMVSRYAKPVLVAEVGMDWQQATAANSMITDLTNRIAALGNHGLGIFYWEPEAFPGWQGYTMGAVDSSGKFTAALASY